MFFMFENVNTVDDSILLGNKIKLDSIEKENAKRIMKIYKSYTNNFFPNIDNVTSKTNFDYIRKYSINNLKEILKYKKDKRIINLKTDIKYLIELMEHERYILYI